MTTINSLDSVVLELVLKLKNGYTLNSLNNYLINNGASNDLATKLVKIAEIKFNN
jgi:hypothetical protein